MELFDFIKVLFERPGEYSTLRPYEKTKFFFMTQRFMSIKYPQAAQAFNQLKVAQAAVLDYWHDNMTKLYSRVPQWMYVKTSGKKKKKKEIEWPDEKAVCLYLQRMQMSRRELQDAVEIFGKKALDPIKDLESMIMEK
jgi:hypothetical protein